MKTSYAVWTVIGVPSGVLLFNLANRLLNTANNSAVYAGYLIFLLLVVVAVKSVVWACRKWGKVLFPCVLLGILAGTCTSCYQTVPPGHVGILVQQTGSQRGVQDFPIKTGRVFYTPWNEDILVYPTSIQRAVWSKSLVEGKPVNEEIAFQSREGLHFTADINCSYELIADQVPHFYVRFRKDDIDDFTHGFLRDTIRNAFNISTEYSAEDINGSKQAELVNRAADVARKVLAPFGVNIVQLGFIAPPRPPDVVRLAYENKIAATQKAEQAENEKREAIAQGEKVKAMAAATAEANREINASLTPQLVQWRQLDVLQSKWNGQMPQVVGSGGMPLLNLK
jgi:regulator of protease activity HflC (stomatin/prohibitin superfamily)